MLETLVLILGATILVQIGFLLRAYQKIHILSERNKWFETKTSQDFKDMSTDISHLCNEGSDMKKILTKLKSEAVTKNEKAFAVLAGTIQDALSQGEGLFLVTRLRDGSYLWKVDRDDIQMTHASNQ